MAGLRCVSKVRSAQWDTRRRPSIFVSRVDEFHLCLHLRPRGDETPRGRSQRSWRACKWTALKRYAVTLRVHGCHGWSRWLKAARASVQTIQRRIEKVQWDRIKLLILCVKNDKMQSCKAVNVPELTSLCVWQLLRGAFGAGDGQRAPWSCDEGVKTQLIVTRTDMLHSPKPIWKIFRSHPKCHLSSTPHFGDAMFFVRGCSAV